MANSRLEKLARQLADLKSLRNLFSYLNYDFEDVPVNQDRWSADQRNAIEQARIIASKGDYKIYYIRTNTDSVMQWKGIATKIIKANNGLCLVCSHNPGGIKWVFSSLSRNFSYQFSETRHAPVDIGPNSAVPKSFVDFLEKIRVGDEFDTMSIISQVSDAFDSLAIQIHDELTVNVFEALKCISEGIITNESNNMMLNENTLEEIRESVFILLYRLIFILYAEDRAVFPIDNTVYYNEFSIKWIKQELLLHSDQVAKLEKYQIQSRLWKFFKLIEIGSEDLGYSPDQFFMKSYYGRLFDRKIHSNLDKWNISNQHLLDAISLLTRTRDKNGNYFFLDYSALETRHLGSIYERLLEYHLTVKNKKIANLPNIRDRKSSGSYYTPQYIVNYIVESSIGPLIDDIVKHTKDPSDQVDKILDLNILDPAMGSGHFLVGATNYMAKRICDIECANDISEQHFVERKRDVARRCIYGVDLNPLAVDLAQVSLWLETLSSERPLSFLSAHLKHGNSLIGSDINSMLKTQTTIMESVGGGRSHFKKAVQEYAQLENLRDDTASAVKAKTEMYTSMQQRGTLYHDLKYLLDAIVSESFGVNVPPTGDYVVKIGQNSLDFYSNDVWDETREISNNYSFFHYDLEFLDVFYDNAGKLKKNPGFDAVVGNPPYGASLSDSEKSYLRKKFQINTTDTAQLMMVAGKRLTKHKGQHSFIVPKAMIHASNWGSIRNHFLKSLQTLVDVGKVWKNVLLEQSIYVIKNGVEFPSYRNGVRENDQIVVDTVIDKKFLKLFGFYLSGITNSDLNLAKKLCQNEMLDKYIINTRGASYQKHSEDKVGLPVLGGRQIRQYYLDGVYGYIDSAKAKDKNAYVTTDSILVQNLITHVLNPVDYIKIISTIPSDTNFVILDSVNQLTMTDKSVSPYYILGLINSKIIRWYAYRFILGKSIRTMHFDNPVTKKFPVVVKNDIQIIDLVKKILKLTNEAYVAKKAPNSNLELDSNKKILVELKIKLNKLFYDNFNLNDEEIQLVESSMPE